MWVVVFQPGSICPFLTLSSPALNSSNTIPITVIKLIALVIVLIGSVALNIALRKSNKSPCPTKVWGPLKKQNVCKSYGLVTQFFFFSVTTTIFLFIYSHQQTLYNSFCSCPPSRNTLSPSPLVLHRHTTIKTISVSS